MIFARDPAVPRFAHARLGPPVTPAIAAAVLAIVSLTRAVSRFVPVEGDVGAAARICAHAVAQNDGIGGAIVTGTEAAAVPPVGVVVPRTVRRLEAQRDVLDQIAKVLIEKEKLESYLKQLQEQLMVESFHKPCKNKL